MDDVAPAREEAQEGPQVRHRVLEARPANARPHRAQEPLELSRSEVSQAGGIAVEAEEREQR